MATPAENQTPTQTPSSPTTTPTDTTPASSTPPSQSTTTPPASTGSSEPATPPAAAAEPATPPSAPAAPAAGEPPAATPPASEPPAEYEIEVADNSPLSDDQLQKIAQHAEKYGLTKEEAQALVADQEALISQGRNSEVERYNAQLEQKRNALNTHPEFSGDKKAEAWDSVTLAIRTFGDDKLLKTLGNPEYGYDPELALFLKNIGDALKPEKPVGNGVNLPNLIDKNAEEANMRRRYPHLNWDDKK